MKYIYIYLLLLQLAFATTYQVNTLSDSSDGSCSDGNCSLRDAITLGSDGDSINITAKGTLYLKAQLPIIDSKTLIISGSGVNDLNISCRKSCRHFKITSGGLYLSNLTLLDGNSTNEYPDSGGAIYADKSLLSITDAGFSSNYSSGNGGAIRVTGGSLHVKGANFNTNTAIASGGAISLAPYLSMPITFSIESTLFKYCASDFGGAVNATGEGNITKSNFIYNSAKTQGGALNLEESRESSDICRISETSFYYNSAGLYGGAINSRAVLQIRQSLLAFNDADYGGAVYLKVNNTNTNNIIKLSMIHNTTLAYNRAYWDTSALYINNTYDNNVSISHSTITNNVLEANRAIGAIGHYLGNVSIKNSIISHNSDNNDSTLLDCSTIDSTHFHSNGHNIMSKNDSPGHECPLNAKDILTTQNQLASFQDNGGNTQTFSLLQGSIAEDNATCTDNEGNRVYFDQRGYPRSSTTCDIGAYENASTSMINSALILYLLN